MGICGSHRGLSPSPAKIVLSTVPQERILAQPGACYVLHRLALHGIAPWGPGAEAPPEGRAVAYFRPQTEGNLDDWLNGDY
jgi:hypothetical protein